MPQFLLDPNQIDENYRRATLVGEEAHHLARVLRAAPGDEVLLFDGRGHRWCATARNVTPREVTLDGLTPLPDGEPDTKLWLIIALVKGERWDWILEKATELGAGKIFPVLTEHTVSKPTPERLTGRMERWRKRILSAAKQCERATLPALEPVRPLAELLEELSAPQPGESRHLFVARSDAEDEPSVFGPHHALLAVGPEGGWSPSELKAFLEKGFTPASLGPRILRSDTAALAALVWAQKQPGML